MYKVSKKHYDALPILSYNAIFNFINGARNIGKSWIFKYRAIFRAKKKGKATYWLRRFDEEVKQTVDKFLVSKFCKMYGLSVYHKKDNPNGNIKREGRKIYVKDYAGKWQIAVQFIALCEYQNYRSADSDEFDTIVFDEYTTTAERYKFYRGDEARDFMDLYISLKREGNMRVFFLGNKETINNPYFKFFGIAPLPLSWQGIRLYKNGAIAVQQVNDALNAEIAYNDKLLSALNGTSYLAYLVDGQAKNEKRVQYCSLPADAKLYGQFDKQGYVVAVYRSGSIYIFDSKLNLSFDVYAATNEQRYPKQKTLTNALKPELYAIRNAVIDNRIAYTSSEARENADILLKWLCGI